MVTGYPFVDDIDAILADSPHSMTVGEVTQPCFFAKREELTAHPSAAPQVTYQATAVVKTGAFPNLAPDTPCTVNGTAYTVFYAHMIQDGAMTEVQLTRRNG